VRLMTALMVVLGLVDFENKSQKLQYKDRIGYSAEEPKQTERLLNTKTSFTKHCHFAGHYEARCHDVVTRHTEKRKRWFGELDQDCALAQCGVLQRHHAMACALRLHGSASLALLTAYISL
jgi:hypothetical protein